MRRVAALALLLVLVTVFLTDPIACADGCTDGDRTSQAAPASSCSLCQRGVALDAVTMGAAPMLTTRSVDEPSWILVLPLFVHPIDHPPRPA